MRIGTALKRLTALLGSSAAIIAMFSCTGPDGPAGANGKDGTNGTDGSAKCAVCHSSNNEIYSKRLQWETSQHATGTAFERNTIQCAPCHTSQGFIECAKSGQDTTLATISDPANINCRTCHKIHQKYDSTDFEFTYNAPIKLRQGNATVDFAGDGNLCGKCHQARAVSPFPAVGATDSIKLTSSRWGPHHGPMTNIIAAKGAFEIPGTLPYDGGSPHKSVPDGCVKCHMASAFGDAYGGHTFRTSAVVEGTYTQNVVACKGCHSSAKNFDIDGVQTEVKAQLIELRGLLAGKRWLDTTKSAGAFHNDLIYPKNYYPSDAGVMFNYLILASDRSWGVHNPKYYKALLKNSLDYLKK